jgi:muramoyltetrapeptide carboxypeptidase
MKASALKKGDTIALIAPASAPVARERITNSVKYFEKLGYRVELGKNIENKYGYLAGSDAERLDDLHTMFRRKDVKAIFFIRGGYGSIRLLPFVDYKLIEQNPKIMVGYSDATALFGAIYKKTGLQSLFFGPMPGVDIWDGFDHFAEECLWRSITSKKSYGLLPAKKDELDAMGKSRRGTAEGRVVGGNLAVFSSILGTPYAPNLSGSMLLFEDIGEEPYRIDRYLAQLRAAGAIERAKGIMLGQFADCGPVKGRPSITLKQVFKDYFGELAAPVVTNLPFGHIRRQWTIPYGAKILIEGTMVSVKEVVLK